MKNLITILLLLLIIQSANSQGDTTKTILWNINRLDSIGGFPVTLFGNPKLIDTEEGKAVEFDGIDDGILINSNPLAGATEFTIEVVFRPYSGGLEEQRFVHIEQDNDNRALIELRSTTDNNWFLDTFIKSGTSNKTLYAEGYKHETEQWWHACLVYKNGIMTHYVDGEEEMSGSVDFAEVTSGNTSLGVRQNLVSWYKGAIKTLKITHKALTPEEFLINENKDTTSVSSILNQKQSLQSNIFPNPVSNSAHINYFLENTARVILEIYNVQTGKIAELVNAVQTAGSYTFSFNRNKLFSGIYFYVLKIDGLETVEKFLIM